MFVIQFINFKRYPHWVGDENGAPFPDEEEAKRVARELFPGMYWTVERLLTTREAVEAKEADASRPVKGWSNRETIGAGDIVRGAFRDQVMRAPRMRHSEYDVFFEHGRWHVRKLATGEVWSSFDTADGIGFEKVVEGEGS